MYLNDTEKKLEIFSDLIKKLDLFTNILNERRFLYKKIVIDKEKGFYFVTEKGDNLKLTDLSSGEQQEVVLLYELLFKIARDTLVLIDEPEISLHVVWQKEFLNDLKKITELQNINAIVATHSPQIINDKWEWGVDLEEINNSSNKGVKDKELESSLRTSYNYSQFSKTNLFSSLKEWENSAGYSLF